MTTLPLSEVFGPTFQGEGPHAGRRCAFVRLGGCNLSCEWCDTPYTWDATRYDLALENPETPIPTIIRSTHSCMGLRGVRKPGAVMVTSVLRGAFRDDPTARAEFLALTKP